jgi:hypothetical protein
MITACKKAGPLYVARILYLGSIDHTRFQSAPHLLRVIENV